MVNSLLELLVDPLSKQPLELEAHEISSNGEIMEGSLTSPGGREYLIEHGIPRFVLHRDENQVQTEESFGYKWFQEGVQDSASVRAGAQKWLVERYGFESIEEMSHYFSQHSLILDAGCGSGYSTSMWMGDDWCIDSDASWVGVDISSAIDLACERLKRFGGTHFIQADILNLPFPENKFDVIFSEGVLHHTPSTEKALKYLAAYLRPGGEVLFYVYRKKGPVREFSDDYIRAIVSALEPEKAWELLRPLTKLGKALAELETEVDVPEDIPYLGIKAGRYDVQRLIYWNFAKMYWNDDRTFEENNAVNFDWYHPRYAHRQTEEEIRRWCANSSLNITRFNIQESGFTVRAIKD